MLAAIRTRIARDPGLACLALALLLAALLYAPTLPRGLTNYDDPWLYADNTIVQHPSVAHLHALFFDLDPAHRFTLGAEYLPVRDLSVTLDYALYGDWYPGFHATSLVLYLAAIILWFHALAALEIDRRVAGLAILFWAIHPSHAESVAWLAERKGILGAAFAGAAVLGYARFRGGRGAANLVLAALAAVAAVWSKAPAAFIIAALAPLELALPGRASWRRSLVGLGVVGAVTAAAFAPVLLVASTATVVGADTRGPADHAALVLGVHGVYAELAAMIPRNAIVYPIASRGPSAVEMIVGALTLLLALGIAIAPRRAPVLRAAAWLWLLGWLPVSHALLPLQNTATDRYLLLPTLGLALAAASLLLRLPAGRGRAALVAVILVAAALRTCDAQASFADAPSLWGRAVLSDPADASAWSHYAEALDAAGDLPGALVAVADGQAAQPTQTPAPTLLLRQALLLREAGDAAGSLAAMRAAAEGGEPRAMSNLALLELAAGHPDDALGWARRGAAASPVGAQAQRTQGKVALADHQPAEALAAFTRAYALEPGYLGNRYNLALALIAVGRGAEARPHLEACLADPVLAEGARAAIVSLPAP